MRPVEAASETPVVLAERIRSGEDLEAEALLVARYARGVRLVLARHTRTAAESEDLFQETFCLAVAKLRAGELREPSKLPGFLASIARRLAIEHYRKATRRRTDTDSEAAEARATAAPAQLGDLLRGEEAALVRRLLEELSVERDREILFRFYIAEEDRDEIAADHGLTSVQLNRLLHRARQRYKSLYLERLAARGRVRAGVALVLFGHLLAASGFARLLVALKS